MNATKNTTDDGGGGGSPASTLPYSTSHNNNNKRGVSALHNNNIRCRKVPRTAIAISLVCILIFVGYGTVRMSKMLSINPPSQHSTTAGSTLLLGYRRTVRGGGGGDHTEGEDALVDGTSRTTTKNVPPLSSSPQQQNSEGSLSSRVVTTVGNTLPRSGGVVVMKQCLPTNHGGTPPREGDKSRSGSGMMYINGSGAVAALPPMRHITWKTPSLPKLAQRVHSKWEAELPEIKSRIHTNEDCLDMADRFTIEREAARLAYLSKRPISTTTHSPSKNSSSSSPSDECTYLPPKTAQRCFKSYTYPFGQIFRDYQLNVMRADVCRVLMVYFHGGIYMDIDVEFKDGFRKQLITREAWKNVDLLLGWENSGDKTISNFMFGAAPRHPCIRSVLEEILRVGQDGVPFKRSNHAVHYTTGPNVLTDGIGKCTIRGDYFIEHPNLYLINGNKMEKEEGVKTKKEEGVKNKNSCLSLDPSSSPSYEPATHDEIEDLKSSNGGGNNNNISGGGHDNIINDDDLTMMMSKTWWKPKIVMAQDDLQGRIVHHHFGSNTWKNGDYGKDSWVTHRKQQMGKLIEGQRVDAIGRDPSKKAPPLTRIIDDDEIYPTLIPKLRHVVELAQPPQSQNNQENTSPPSSSSQWVSVRNHRGTRTLVSPQTAESMRHWDPHTSEYFTTVIHDMESCVRMGVAYSNNNKVKWGDIMSEDLCGVLAVYASGGLYIGSHIHPLNITTTTAGRLNVTASGGGGGILSWSALPWNSSDLITVEIEATTRSIIRTDFIAARPSHECLRSAIHQLQFIDTTDGSTTSSPSKRPTNIDKKFSNGFYDCKLKPDFFPFKEWVIYFVNGFTLRQLRYDWAWRKTSGGSKPVETYYVQDTMHRIFTPKASVTERELAKHLSLEFTLLLPTTTTSTPTTTPSTTATSSSSSNSTTPSSSSATANTTTIQNDDTFPPPPPPSTTNTSAVATISGNTTR